MLRAPCTHATQRTPPRGGRGAPPHSAPSKRHHDREEQRPRTTQLQGWIDRAIDHRARLHSIHNGGLTHDSMGPPHEERGRGSSRSFPLPHPGGAAPHACATFIRGFLHMYAMPCHQANSLSIHLPVSCIHPITPSPPLRELPASKHYSAAALHSPPIIHPNPKRPDPASLPFHDS